MLLPGADHVPLGEDAEAKLLIGDAALKSAFEDPTPHYDLGRLWQERTGLPMVFAVWAAPEPTHPELPELEDALVSSVRAARAEPERLAFESSERYGYPAGFLARYFEKLRYSFGPRERAGLYAFLELARDVGELDHVPELRFVARAEAPVRAMSAYIVTRIHVGDYDRGVPMFDQDRPRAREQARLQRVLRDVDDPNHVFIYLEFDVRSRKRRRPRTVADQSGVLDRFVDKHGPNVLQDADA